MEADVQIADYEVFLNEEEKKVYIQFPVDMSSLRRPESLVIEAPDKPVTLEDEQGIIAVFNRSVTEEEFAVFALAGVVHLLPLHPESGIVETSIPVSVQGRVRIVDDPASR